MGEREQHVRLAQRRDREAFVGRRDLELNLLERDVLAERPTLVIWQTGSNDPMTGVSVERFAKLTRDGIAAIRSTGAVGSVSENLCRRG